MPISYQIFQLFNSGANVATPVPANDPLIRSTNPELVKCRDPTGDSCQWYRKCLNKYNKCEKDEYALNYGEKFCEKFSQSYSGFSSQAQRWINDVRKCLQKNLAPLVGTDTPCAKLRKQAFDSHTACYVDNGLCVLPYEEQKKVIGVVKEAFIPFAGSAWATTKNTLATIFTTSCLGQWLTTIGADETIG